MNPEQFEELAIATMQKEGWHVEKTDDGCPLLLSEGSLAVACVKAGYTAALTPAVPAPTPAPADAVGRGWDSMSEREEAYFASLQAMAPAQLLTQWDEMEEQSHMEAESYKPAYVNLLRKALRNALYATPTPAPATVAPGAAGEAAILAMLDYMDAAKARASANLHNVDLTEEERLDFAADYDNAAALRFDGLAAAYRRLSALTALPAASAAPEAGPGGGRWLQGDPATNPFGPR